MKYVLITNTFFLGKALPGYCGHNCRFGLLLYPKYEGKENETTDFIGFKPCDISEYITHKLPMGLGEFNRQNKK